MNLYFEFSEILYLTIFLIPFLIYRIYTSQNDFLRFPTIQIRGNGRLNVIVYYSKFLLESILLGFMMIGIASPYSVKEKNSFEERGIDICLVLDISASMQATDFFPNRLESMKALTIDFIKRSSKNRMGIVVFAGKVFTQSPLTSDHEVLSELVNNLSFGSIDHNESGGTAIGDALLTSTDILLKNKIQNRDQVVVLITDGENTEGVDPLLAARYIKESMIRLYIIGLGGKKEVPVYVNQKPYLSSNGKILTTSLFDADLKNIANLASGKYFQAKDTSVLTDIFDELNLLESTLIEKKGEVEKVSHNSVISQISLSIFILLLLVNYSFRRPMK